MLFEKCLCFNVDCVIIVCVCGSPPHIASIATATYVYTAEVVNGGQQVFACWLGNTYRMG